ncbi:MAG: sulfur relay protein DsrC [Gammaproteobacteria bacterium]|nr:sulfur relay protein DsrC [Gammaproteobacteria bacterium]
MLWLSEVLLQQYEITSFEQLKTVIAARAAQGEMFFRMDVKPPYGDTPANWEDQLESAFTSGQRR